MFRKKDKREEVQKQNCEECVFKHRYNELDEKLQKICEHNCYLGEKSKYLTEIMNEYEKQNRELVKLLAKKDAESAENGVRKEKDVYLNIEFKDKEILAALEDVKKAACELERKVAFLSGMINLEASVQEEKDCR